jgi:hypothetical protein
VIDHVDGLLPVGGLTDDREVLVLQTEGDPQQGAHVTFVIR